MRFSTSVPNDPDTHDDFKPTNKLENSQLTLKDIVEQVGGYCQVYQKTSLLTNMFPLDLMITTFVNCKM